MVEEAPDGFTRWETPLGPVWVPPGNSPVFAIGEQLAEVYSDGHMAFGAGRCSTRLRCEYWRFRASEKVVATQFFAGDCQRAVVVVAKGVWHEDSTMKMVLYENSLLDSFVMQDRPENQLV